MRELDVMLFVLCLIVLLFIGAIAVIQQMLNRTERLMDKTIYEEADRVREQYERECG